jgi:hypothetical protein
MAFTKKTWKDRLTEYPTRRRITKSDGTSELVTVSREEGTVSQAGDAFSAANMNDLENRIAAGLATADGSKTMTYAQYQALTDAQKKDGTTYYVPDAPGSGSGDSVKDSNMYYDPTTDTKYLKGQDGTWVAAGSGGLLWDGSLYRSGNTYSDITGSFSLYQVAGTGGGSYSLVFNTNNLTVTSTSSLGILSTNNKIDFSKYTKLHIEGTLKHTDGDSVVFTVGFSTSKNATDTSVYSFEIGKTTKTIAETIDISTHNSNPLYVHINLCAYYKYKWVGNFVLTNFYFLP